MSHSRDLDTMLSALKTPLPPHHRPPGYLPGLLATAFFAVLMPLVYLGLIAGVGLFCWWHLSTNGSLLGLISHGFNGLFAAVFLYLGPLLGGIVMIVFLVRPLFVRAEVRPESKVLNPDQAPEFVALVHAVADAVGAPRPAEIRLDSQVNASASFRDGFAGWIKGELTLTVGLPLLEGMNTREVVGILGHEFGHFAQGGGMRLSFVVRSLIYWFQRVVNHRDEWDLKLDRNAKESDIRIGVFFHLARFFVWASRSALSAVAKLSHLVCVFLLRAMEYDADRHEARIAGSEQFARTAHHLRRLGLAWRQANGEAARAWNDGALPRNFTAYVGHLEQRIDSEVDQKLVEGVKAEKRNIWATHPRDVDRIARAEAAAEPGIFQIEAPCSTLFADFRTLSEACSDVYYAARLGQSVDPERYRETEDVLLSSDELRLDREAYAAAVSDWAGLILPLDWYRHASDADLPVDDRAAVASIETARETIVEANSKYDAVLGSWKEKCCYLSAQSAGYDVARHLAPLEGQDLDLAAATEGIQSALAPVHRRFARALATPTADNEALLEVHRRFAAQAALLHAWHVDHSTLAYLIQQSDNQKAERWNEIQRLLGRLKDSLSSLEGVFSGLPYAFAERDGVSLNDHLLGGPVSSLDDPNDLFRQSGVAMERASQVYVRTLGRLARRLVATP